MRSIAKLMQDWQFTGPDGKTTLVELPHTWNAKDGQDGGNDYYRGTCWYTLALAKPTIPAGGKAVLQLDGAAMTAAVYLNGEKLAQHRHVEFPHRPELEIVVMCPFSFMRLHAGPPGGLKHIVVALPVLAEPVGLFQKSAV